LKAHGHYQLLFSIAPSAKKGFYRGCKLSWPTHRWDQIEEKDELQLAEIDDKAELACCLAMEVIIGSRRGKNRSKYDKEYFFEGVNTNYTVLREKTIGVIL
jgi:hypothetical protein